MGDVPSPNKVLTVISVTFASHRVLPVLSVVEAKAPRSCTVLALATHLLVKIVVNFVHISIYMIRMNCLECSITCKGCLVSCSVVKFLP